VEGVKCLFVDQFQVKKVIAGGAAPAPRPVFRRTHGVAHGTFVVRPDLPPELRVGVFAQKSEYPIWVTTGAARRGSASSCSGWRGPR
jgi:hypothetical protein